jgi:hypothetical protein
MLRELRGTALLPIVAHCCPFKIQTVQELSERDKRCSTQFCSQFLDVVLKSPGVENALTSLRLCVQTECPVLGTAQPTWSSSTPPPQFKSECTVRGTFLWHYWSFSEDDPERAVTVNTRWYKVRLEHFLANVLHHCDLPACF